MNKPEQLNIAYRLYKNADRRFKRVCEKLDNLNFIINSFKKVGVSEEKYMEILQLREKVFDKYQIELKSLMDAENKIDAIKYFRKVKCLKSLKLQKKENSLEISL